MPLPRFGAIATVLVCFGGYAAAENIRTERVRFAPGKTSSVIEGRISGYDTVDYVLGARQGQSMNVSMASNNGANYFNILAPSETEVAFFNGSVSQNQYEGVLPKTGDYRIRVYMMRSAARRNEYAGNAGRRPTALSARRLSREPDAHQRRGNRQGLRAAALPVLACDPSCPRDALVFSRVR